METEACKMTRVVDIINLVIAGILSLLWFDIRAVRKAREEDEKERSADKLDREQQANKMKNEMYDVFLTQTRHGLICENAALKIKQHISVELANSEKRILAAIKQNGHS